MAVSRAFTARFKVSFHADVRRLFLVFKSHDKNWQTSSVNFDHETCFDVKNERRTSPGGNKASLNYV